ncbi:MAG TPA: glycosyltransferase family 2 protein [Methylomirabilota bacterium]|nr:glycosyltransferase family 2 protein [Methylomirabilota bacterium]
MKPLILVPVYDEAGTIASVVTAARRHGPVLVVDDGSRDDSGARAAAAGAEVLRHTRRLGKAQALRTGIDAARGRGVELLVTLDGDGQHDPDDLPALLAAAAPRTMVIGGRVAQGEALPVDRLNAIRIAGFFVNWAGGVRLLDTQSGFRVYPLALFDEVRPTRGGFVFETEVLLAAVARGWRVIEVPVAVRARAGQRSRFRPVQDGIAIGGFIAARALARWGTEALAAGAAVLAVLDGERMRARHAAILEAAAPYADSPSWGWAIGSMSAQRMAARLAHWWRHPRRRRATAAAPASVLAPAAVGLMLAQALAGRLMPDVLTPLVSAIYSQERLDVIPAPPVRAEAPAEALTMEPRA